MISRIAPTVRIIAPRKTESQQLWITKKEGGFGGEIVINKIANAGKVYLVPPLNKKISLGMNQFMIRPKEGLDDYFLYVFLVSTDLSLIA